MEREQRIKAGVEKRQSIKIQLVSLIQSSFESNDPEKKFQIFTKVFEVIYNNLWLMNNKRFYEVVIDRLEYIRSEECKKILGKRGEIMYNKYIASIENKLPIRDFVEKRSAKKIQKLWDKYWNEPYNTIYVEEKKEDGSISKVQVNVIRSAEYSWKKYNENIKV